ncbi:AraC family transcriptional regulator [Paenibacillus abyssi]|uniref:HTH araC/xylS-type domain-containing protein n=1 Tax=Paenibacillus abyssi TaxID=1340531 RepID=A0A917CMW3_9BACL|nr:AraC family transcriptional regulator [Paenibacillus abyssi]GGF92972.1 hypothetical protein GCM10010916_07910 [Paenibacillus abyssi]
MALHHFPERFALRYIATEEYTIEGRLSLAVPNQNEPRFGYVTKENVTINLNPDRQFLAETVLCGELFFVPPNRNCLIHNPSPHASQIVMIRFQWEEGKDLITARMKQGAGRQRESRVYRHRIPQALAWMQDFTRSEGDSLALHYQRLSHLYAFASSMLAGLPGPEQAEDELMSYVKQIKQRMLERCDTDMDMEELARQSGASPSRFYQTFKHHTGLSPHKFMTNVRLNASLSLLANSTASILEVAHSIGYSDELYFSRLFKKHMGITPTLYSTLARKRIANLSPVFQGDLSVLGITPALTLPRGWSDHPEQYMGTIERCQPELIFTPPVPDDVYRTLSTISPVVMLHWKGAPWKERLLEISRVLGLSSVAERWLAYFDAKVLNARTHIREHLGETPFLLVSAHEGWFRVFGMLRRKMKDLFYDDLQMTPPAPAKRISFLDTPSLRDIAALDCSNVLFLTPTTAKDDFCAGLEAEWRELKKDQPEKHCLFIRYEPPLLYNAAFHESLVDQMVNQLQRPVRNVHV